MQGGTITYSSETEIAPLALFRDSVPRYWSQQVVGIEMPNGIGQNAFDAVAALPDLDRIIIRHQRERLNLNALDGFSPNTLSLFFPVTINPLPIVGEADDRAYIHLRTTACKLQDEQHTGWTRSVRRLDLMDVELTCLSVLPRFENLEILFIELKDSSSTFTQYSSRAENTANFENAVARLRQLTWVSISKIHEKQELLSIPPIHGLKKVSLSGESPDIPDRIDDMLRQAKNQIQDLELTSTSRSTIANFDLAKLNDFPKLQRLQLSGFRVSGSSEGWRLKEGTKTGGETKVIVRKELPAEL